MKTITTNTLHLILLGKLYQGWGEWDMWHTGNRRCI